MYAKPKTKKNDQAVTDNPSAQRKGVSMPAVPVLHEATVQRNAVDEKEAVQGKFETKQLKEDEEVPLQGKFETTQLKDDEEVPLQGKFETTQLKEEEELPAQGKFETAQLKEEEELPAQGKFEAAQLKEEEELPAQGKFETAQLKEEEELPAQGKFETTQLKEEEELPAQGKFAERATAQLEDGAPKPNNTGLPDNLKTGIESLSGMSMDHVKVHYGSDKPSQLNAHAYAQGSDIHLAPGQEQHLPHEAWHVVQQAQGRVKPTMQMKGNVPVNDDRSLEHEADVMGSKAATTAAPVGQLKETNANGQVAQLAGTKPNQPSANGQYRIKLSSRREEFTYTNRAALGLDAVLPGHHPVTHGKRGNISRKLKAVKIAGSDAWIDLKEPIDWPGTDQKVLCIDTVGWEDESAKEVKDQKCVLDVKIGTYTKSSEQFAVEGAGVFKRFFKKIEHNLKDLNRDSRKLGYDIDADNLTEFLRLAIDRNTTAQLHAAMIAVRSKLLAIKARMAGAPITFVGSSLFFVFNLTNPEASDVKLIDPDHPIVTDPGELQVPDYLIRGSNFTGGRSWDDYVQKWRTGFGTGMDKFLEWFDNLAGTGG